MHIRQEKEDSGIVKPLFASLKLDCCKNGSNNVNRRIKMPCSLVDLGPSDDKGYEFLRESAGGP